MSAAVRSRRSAQQEGRGRHALRIEASFWGGQRVLRLSGELDLASRAFLEDVLGRLATGGCTVLLDLSRLTFIDSSGVHVAIAACELCAARGCELRLIAGPTAIQRVFALAGVLDRLPFQAEETRPRPGSSRDRAEGERLAARVARRRREPSDGSSEQWTSVLVSGPGDGR